MADAINSTLRDRDRNYNGIPFMDRAAFSQTVKDAFRKGPLWAGLGADQKEALDMIAHKLARIVCGNPAVVDHWHDIGGYVRLVEEELLKAAGEVKLPPQTEAPPLPVTASKPIPPASNLMPPPAPLTPPQAAAVNDIVSNRPAIPSAPPVKVPDRPQV